MAILHQVALFADCEKAWESLAAASAPGDIVVLMDPAVAAAALATVCVGVRICLLRSELPDDSAPPEAVELIDDAQWWQLIVDHELIQHWM